MGESYINIVVIAGVRPQFTKIAALQLAIAKFNKSANTKIQPVYINTGQHYDPELAQSFIDEQNIRFDFQLSHSNKHPIHILGSMIIGVYQILDNLDSPTDWVIVNGDATTALAGALAAARKKIPVVHVEAGMRSGNLIEPEEINRRMIDHISSLHVCTSRAAVENLKNEGIINTVFWPGDLTFEFIEEYAKRLPAGIEPYPVGEYIIATLHKDDNISSDETLSNFVFALSSHNRPVIFITHPRTRKRLIELNLLNVHGVSFLNSLPYNKMLSALKGCAFVVTDSGGLHREAYYFRRRCLVRRDSGGWSKLIALGIHKRIGRKFEDIINGLEWIEAAIQEGEYHHNDDDDLIKRGSNEAMLQKIVDLSNIRNIENIQY